jgi:hypothetical protein
MSYFIKQLWLAMEADAQMLVFSRRAFCVQGEQA